MRPGPLEVRGAARSPRPKAMCSWPSTSPSKLKTLAVVVYPSPKRSGTGTWVRIVAVGNDGGGIGGLISVVLKPRRERIAQQHHVADLANLGERRPSFWVPGETAITHEPRGPGVADEERGHDKLQLVD